MLKVLGVIRVTFKMVNQLPYEDNWRPVWREGRLARSCGSGPRKEERLRTGSSHMT